MGTGFFRKVFLTASVNKLDHREIVSAGTSERKARCLGSLYGV